MQQCQRWLQKSDQHRYFEKQIKKTIKIFHHNTVNFDKKTIITEFQQLDEHSSVHVIFATEALGMDVNLSDVWHVVLYRLPKRQKPGIAWQQDDRAGRDELNEEIILLVDQWIIDNQIKILSSQKQKSSQNSQLLNEDELIADETKLRKLTSDEHHSKPAWFFTNVLITYQYDITINIINIVSTSYWYIHNTGLRYWYQAFLNKPAILVKSAT